MFGQQTMQGNCNEIKGLLRSKWGQLTDDDLAVLSGNVDQLVGVIQRRTGEARESIERFHAACVGGGAAAVNEAGDAVRKGYGDVKEIVRDRPAGSLALGLGMGILTGVVVSWLMRRR